MAKRGKQGDERYRSLSGRIPADLRAAFKRKLADYDLDMTIDIFLERVVSMWVRGDIEVGTPNPPREPVASERYEPAHVTRARLAGEYTPEQRRAIWHLGMNEHANELKRVRTALGLTYEQFADALGKPCAASTLHRYEHGEHQPKQKVLDALQTLKDKHNL